MMAPGTLINVKEIFFMNNDAHNPQPADSHGALDLSAAASAAGQGGPSTSQQTSREGGAGGISIPLIDSCDDSS
ncbi:MAG: co-chaperone YbbN, partial [Trueperella pyogenes]|nr:co-chaperone YbbN [Trueperella pyogenes]